MSDEYINMRGEGQNALFSKDRPHSDQKVENHPVQAEGSLERQEPAVQNRARAEPSDLEFLTLHPKTPEAFAGGVRRWGAPGEQKVCQFIRSFLHPMLLWTCSQRRIWAAFSEPVCPTHSSKATSCTKLFSVFPQTNIMHLSLWNCLGEQIRSLLSAGNTVFLTFFSPSYRS